jgi:hypothetical protein
MVPLYRYKRPLQHQTDILQMGAGSTRKLLRSTGIGKSGTPTPKGGHVARLIAMSICRPQMAH